MYHAVSMVVFGRKQQNGVFLTQTGGLLFVPLCTMA